MDKDRRDLLKKVGISGGIGLGGALIGASLLDDGGNRNGPETPTRTTPGPGQDTDDGTGDPDTGTPVEPRHADEYGTVVDAVAAGADPTGDEPIAALIEKHAGDDTLLSFRPGTYRLPRISLSGYHHLGIAAAGDDHPRFVAPAGTCTDSDPHVRFQGVTDLLLEGIEFDLRQPGAGGVIYVVTSGDATVRDVAVQGSCRAQVAMFRIDIRDPDSTGLVERLRMRQVQDTGWLTGVFVGDQHAGSVTFRNCELRGFTDNGLYGSAPGIPGGAGGTVHTVGSQFENNNVSNIRLGSDGSSARGDSVVVESAPEASTVNLRGVRFRYGIDQVVEDCDIRFGPNVTDSFGAVVYHADNRGARLANSTITIHSDGVPAVKAFYHSGGGDGAPVLENVTVDGDASRGYAVLMNGRDGAIMRNCTIDQQGEGRDGIRLAYCDGCELIDSHVAVDGLPLVLRDTTLSIRNTTFVTPDGERHVDSMEAGPGDFRPETWST